LNGEGQVDWDKVEARWKELSSVKVSLANKYFTEEVGKKAREL
jgi:arginine kinase